MKQISIDGNLSIVCTNYCIRVISLITWENCGREVRPIMLVDTAPKIESAVTLKPTGVGIKRKMSEELANILPFARANI